MSLTLPSIEDVSAQLKSRSISPVDLVHACLDRIESRLELNAFITVMADSAVSAAEAAEQEIAAGQYRGPLHGVPISVKDLVDVAGTPTTSGSAVAPRLPAKDAPIVTRLRDAGAIIIGKRTSTSSHSERRAKSPHSARFIIQRIPRDRPAAPVEARLSHLSRVCASDPLAPTPGGRFAFRRPSAERLA